MSIKMPFRQIGLSIRLQCNRHNPGPNLTAGNVQKSQSMYPLFGCLDVKPCRRAKASSQASFEINGMLGGVI